MKTSKMVLNVLLASMLVIALAKPVMGTPLSDESAIEGGESERIEAVEEVKELASSERTWSNALGWYEWTAWYNVAGYGVKGVSVSCPSGREAISCSCWNSAHFLLTICDARLYLGPGKGPGKTRTCQAYFYNRYNTAKNVRLSVKAYCV